MILVLGTSPLLECCVSIEAYVILPFQACNFAFMAGFFGLKLSWSVLGHVLSEEQSKVSSDRVSDDGHLTIVQCHHYHRPPSSDLYWSSIGILPPLHYHQNNLHSYHCHYQSTPCVIYRSTTTAPPCSTHVPYSRPITSRTHQSQGHESQSPQGPARIYVGILRHHPEYESLCYMFILLPYALHNNS